MIKDKIFVALLFVLALGIGILIRTINFPEIPPGLNQDEANSATETYALLTTGKDKWGNAYPAYFPSWGSGQSVLMAYLSIPAVKLVGLNVFSARLVPLLIGILTLPLFFFCLLPFGRYPALLGMFILAIVPWHFMMSRWALECNLVPFFMLLGCGTLSRALITQQKKWMLCALLPFALAIYSYGTTVIVWAVFFMIVLFMHYKLFHKQWKTWLTALSLFALVVLPFGLFFLENYILKYNLPWTDHLFFSTPMCPVNRLEQSENLGWPVIQSNMSFLFSGFDDRTDYNMLRNFSVLIPFIFPVSMIAFIYGVYILIRQRKTANENTLALSVFVAWMLASLVLVVFFDLNINRFNHFFIPCIALFVWGVSRILLIDRIWLKYISLAILVLLSSECFLAMRYYLDEYPNSSIKYSFHEGLKEAFDSAQTLPVSQIHITKEMRLPYVYTLFYTQYPPAKFQREAVYEIKNGEYKVNRFGKYVFYEEYLDKNKAYGYLSRKDEFQAGEGQHKTVVFTNEQWEVGILE